MNVLYITIDALRADHVTPDVMPTMHSFIKDNLAFTSCYANGPGTPWSFPSLLSSRYAVSTPGFGIPDDMDSHLTLAEVLSEEGYATAGFTDNRFASSDYNYDRGMDEMFDEGATSKIKLIKQFVRENMDHDGTFYQALLRGYHIIDDLLLSMTSKETRFLRSEALTEQLLPWINEQDRNWFAWLHLMDTHAPYEAPEEYQQRFLDESVERRVSQKLARKATHHPDELTTEDWNTQKQLYKAECAYLDDQLAQLFNSLDTSVREQTVVVFTADHGEMHGEHGFGGHPQQFWEEVIHVPCAVSVPSSEDYSTDAQIGLVDVPPTILDAVDVTVPSEWDGHARLPDDNGTVEPREHVFIDVGAKLNRLHAGVRRADSWKLMRHDDEGELLLNISENSSEDPENNQIESEPAVYNELTAQLDLHFDEMEKRQKKGLTGIEDEEMIEDHLQELGYLE
jgi:arylsulfatase A-like enzyme